MNALRNERDDDDLTTADLIGRGRRDNMPLRQAYNGGLEPEHAEASPADNRRDLPADYTPPPSSRPGPVAVVPDAVDRTAKSIPSQIPPAAPVASVPAPPATEAASGPAPGPVAVPSGATGPGHPGALFPEDELHNYRARWDHIQASFVDEPRKAVQGADSLVANVVKRIAEQFANEREDLEKQWDRGDNINTEDLRQAFKRYRAFFDRLLSF